MINIFDNKDMFKGAYVQKIREVYKKDVKDTNILEQYSALTSLLNEKLYKNWQDTERIVKEKGLKKTIYFSMEFLMGRLITNNLQNSGVYDVVKNALADLNIDLNALELSESDAGLGNGGLGRLAACFLDSGASLGLPLYGNSLRYQHGFFKQVIKDNKQVELPDAWLENPFVWEYKQPEDSINIPFFGEIKNAQFVNQTWVKAVPYDVLVVGDQNDVVTTLRIWSTEPSELMPVKDQHYMKTVRNISDVLYPDDSTEEGRILRLQQQYLFSSAGVQNAIREHKKFNRDIMKFHEYYSFQINDTHPALVIPELMRILMDENGLEYVDAWDITTKTCAFTNHTILAEALEKWNIHTFKKLLPRIYEITLEINRRFLIHLNESGKFSKEQIDKMAILNDHEIRMAHLSIEGSNSVNGVAKLHTDILTDIEMKDFYTLYPEKFNNKTNGITHRRWLIHTNHELVSILDKYIGKTWRQDLNELEKLAEFKDDKKVQIEIDDMKRAKKQALADRIFNEQGIKLDVNSIFDIQVKRLHQYKRQLMNILHIIYVYQRLKTDVAFRKNYFPHSFIFGAKSAPSYKMAKAVIELINAASHVINNDPETNDLLKVVFVENYNVTYAEYIMPAADLSEQISTASKEASGTGNMKFMMNGALTIGTLDGANVEIVDLAGRENAIIFGLTAKEVTDMYKNNSYNPKSVFEKSKELQDVFAFIRNLDKNPHHFDFILDDLLNSDYFLVLADFDAYRKAHEIANELYKDRSLWLSKSIMNIAKSGYFTSDRTINNYNKDIWHLQPIK